MARACGGQVAAGCKESPQTPPCRCAPCGPVQVRNAAPQALIRAPDRVSLLTGLQAPGAALPCAARLADASPSDTAHACIRRAILTCCEADRSAGQHRAAAPESPTRCGQSTKEERGMIRRATEMMADAIRRAAARRRRRKEQHAPGYVGTGAPYGSWAPGFYPAAMPQGGGGRHVPGVAPEYK